MNRLAGECRKILIELASYRRRRGIAKPPRMPAIANSSREAGSGTAIALPVDPIFNALTWIEVA